VKRGGRTQQGAYDKALGYLARREHSERELAAKLARGGLEGDAAQDAITRLKAQNYQSDTRFGEMLVRTRIEAGYGPRWIVAELRTHGIDEAQARALIDEAEPDWEDIARRQLRRRYGPKRAADAAERAKRATFLLRRGFPAATVQSVTRAEGLEPSPDELD